MGVLKASYTAGFKKECVRQIKDNEATFEEIIQRHGVSERNLKNWIRGRGVRTLKVEKYQKVYLGVNISHSNMEKYRAEAESVGLETPVYLRKKVEKLLE